MQEHEQAFQQQLGQQLAVFKIEILLPLDEHLKLDMFEVKAEHQQLQLQSQLFIKNLPVQQIHK